MNTHLKGLALEQEVAATLWQLERRFRWRVTVHEQPRISLESGETVVPDFDLVVELPFTRLHYFIECQDRERNSKDIVHRLTYIREKQWRNTFIFVYRASASQETLAALEKVGVITLDLAGFRDFVARIEATLEVLPPTDGFIPDQGMIGGV